MVLHPALPERDRRILGVVVSAYIEQGEPVSSLWLAKGRLGVSSATLRNILARLEEQGYVRQPHTSAGRVPTDLGYRNYVDRRPRRAPEHADCAAMSKRGCARRERSTICSRTCRRKSRARRIRLGSRSRRPPIPPRSSISNFVPLDGGKILVVVVAAGGHVSHKVIEPTEQYDQQPSSQQAANYLNSEFKGRTLLEVRQAVLERLREERTLYDVLMSRALRLASATLRGRRLAAGSVRAGNVDDARGRRRRRSRRDARDPAGAAADD